MLCFCVFERFYHAPSGTPQDDEYTTTLLHICANRATAEKLVSVHEDELVGSADADNIEYLIEEFTLEE